MMNRMLTHFDRQRLSVCSQLKRFWKKTLILVLFTALGSFDVSAQTITIDGNPIDWNSSNFNLFLTKKYQGDAFGNGVVDNQFTEGSKDFFYANQLVWSISQTKAKNDIANGAAVLQNGILYFAGDRVSNNGDAQIGFWLYLNGTGPTTVNGINTFSPPHADGDVLVLADFTGGGKNATVTIYQWDASGNGNVPNTNGNLRTTNLTGTVAENNAGEYPIPVGWSFPTSTYKYNMFYEGRVDLTQLNLPSLCNASFLLETRSSQSITASLDDFVGGSFNATPLPLVLSGSAFCSPALSSGTITSSTSEAGFSYQLYNSSNVAVGSPKIGTGSGLTWTGIPAGSGYYVVGAGQVNCTSTSNSVAVTQKQASSSTQSRAICNNQLPYTWDGLTFTGAGTQTKTGLTNAAGCDSTATYTITVKLTSSSTQSRAICNNQLPYTWDGLTFTGAGTQTKTGLTNAAGCDSTATYTITVKLTSSSNQSRAICNNQLPYTWDGLTFTGAGTQTKTGLTNAAGCDSTATYTITVKLTSSSNQSRAICNNQLPYTWDGLTFTEAGTKTKTGLTNAAGCDSTATYTITVKLTSSSNQSRAICNNQLPYTWDGLTFTEAGTKTKTGLTNAAGCDSTATYTITVKLTSSSNQSRAICNNQLPYTWDGLTFTEAGTKTKTGLTNAAGCDSTATYTITVKLTSSSNQSRAICNNQLPYTWDGLTFTEAGTKTKTGLTNAAGCDSTATYTITVKLTSSSNQSRAICNNQLPYTWDGLTFTEAGTKTKTGLTNAAGCDSTAAYTITVKLTSSSNQSRAICNNQLPYTWDGLTFTEAGTKTKTGLTNAAGCDSTATYTITVKLTSSSNQSRAICNNQLPYTWDGLTFTEAGTKTKTGLTNAAGCDSTATYTITVKLTSSSNQSRAICNNQLPYSWDGLTFTEAGTKTKTGLTNAAGCDSTATYTITVKLTSYSNQSRAICNNQLPYTWDGLIFTEAGTKTKTGLTNAAGCDSTATYTITVKLTSSSSQSMSVCSAALPFTWDGLTFTEAGTQTKTGLTNAAGCDSSATYTLSLYPNPTCSIVGGTIGGGPLCVGGGLPAPAPIYSGPAGLSHYKWTVSGNISIKDGIDNQQTVTIIVTGNGTLTLEVTNEYGCTSTCSKEIQVQQNAPCNLTGPDKVCVNSTNTYSTAAVDGATYNWTIEGNATILSSKPYGNSIQVKAGGAGSYTVHLTIEKPEACPSACEWTTDVENCAKPYCTYTQGYYGNSGGKACTPQGTKTTLQLITGSISNMPGSVLYLGKPGRSFTATVADAGRIITIMPGGGSPTTLPAGNWTANSLPVSKQGRINNVLLSQTIALALNTYMGGSTLGDLSLADAGGKYMITVARKDGTCGTLSTDAAECKFKPVYGIDGVTIVGYTTSYNPYKATYFSPAIVNALGGSKTVKDLLALASAVLGGAPLPAGVSYSNLSDAVASINEGFDECKLFVTFSSTSNVSGFCTPPVVVTPTGTKMRPVVQADVTNQINITAYPNPFKGQLNFRFVSPASGRATLEVFNIFGQKLETVFDGDVTKDRSYFATFRKGLNGQNMIIYKLTVGGKVVTGKAQSME